MTRPVCFRALAFLQMAALGLCSATADAGQSEPPLTGGPADPQTSTPAQPPATDAQGKIQKPGVQPNTGQAPPTPLIQTPAQLRYGLPRNPLIGATTDVDVSKPLSLERAIQIALARQNQIGIAVAQRDQNGALLQEARSRYFPQITPGVNYQSTLTPTYFVGVPNSTGNGTGTGTNTGTGTGRAVITRSLVNETRTDSIVAQQLIYDSGIREANVGFSRRNLFASEYNLGNVRQTVILQVTQDYYILVRDKELVRVQEESVRRAQTTLDSIEAQVTVGNAAQSDTFQARSDLANAKVSLLQAQNTAFVDEASLKNAMGIVTSVPLILSTDTVPKPSTDPDPRNLEEYVKQAYNYRLDLKQQQEFINAQGYNVKIANINAGVTVNATVNEGYQIAPNTGEERTFVVGFSYPLFDGGLTRGAIKASKAVLEEDRRSLDQLQQNVRLAVEQDYLTREVSRQQVAAAQVAVEAGQKNYDAALEKQRNGLVNVLDVINAEVQLVTAQVQQVQAIYNFYIADAGLQRDIGHNDPLYVPNVPAERKSRGKGAIVPAKTALNASSEQAPVPTIPAAPILSVGNAPAGATGRNP